MTTTKCTPGVSAWLAVTVLVTAACDPGPQSNLTVETAQTSRAVVTDCDFLNSAITPPLAVPVDYARELVITHLPVVEDPCRTTNFPAGACAPGTVGVWTFRELMMRMKGTRPLRRFVQEWVSTFETPTVVNGFPVPAYPNARARFIDPWVVASGCPAGAPIVGAGACPLDIARAPFRLLGIVNRVDLSGVGFGATEPGEARFVFGLVDATTGAALQSTVILEYHLPPGRDAFQWETLWHQLSGLPPASGAYRNQLHFILDQVTRPGSTPGAPNNGTAIGQVRTNDLDMGFVWDLREFTLQDIGMGPNRFGLRNDTVKQTPDDSLNLTPALDAYLVADEPNILNVTHTVPAALLGGRSTAPFIWDNGGTAGPIGVETRHVFGFATCNGCHRDETATAFVHITPRAAGVQAGLSPFMGVSPAPTGAGSGLPAGMFSVLDPAGSGTVFDYNEPWRRVCEATRILNGVPDPFTKATGAH